MDTFFLYKDLTQFYQSKYPGGWSKNDGGFLYTMHFPNHQISWQHSKYNWRGCKIVAKI